MSITPEAQLRRSACIQEIAQILYKNTDSEEIATWEGLEKVVHQQMLEYVSPKIALFWAKKSPKQSKGDRARLTVWKSESVSQMLQLRSAYLNGEFAV